MTKQVRGDWTVPETTRLTELEILPGGRILPPPGHTLTMTVDGVGTTPEPGRWQGDIVLTAARDFRVRSVRFGEITEPNFRMAVCVSDGKYRLECSVPDAVRGGSVTDTEARGIRIRSGEWDFNGVYVTGDSEYTVADADIALDGDGTDDFVGLGAGVAATGNARLTVKNSRIRTRGVTRGTVFAGGSAEVKLEDCELSLVSYVPTAKQLAEGAKLERMMQPPWSMGIRGNGRATNLAGWGVLHLDRCHVTSNSWGVLSVDGATVNRMYVKDSLIELTGDSGYGCFSICDDLAFDYKAFGDHGCVDRIENSVLRVPTYGAILSLGNAGCEFSQNTVVESRRFGALIFRNSGGYLRVDTGAQLRTKEACFLVKGANTFISADSARLLPENGIILQLMDDDDTGMEGYPFQVPVGERDEKLPGRDLTTADKTEDVFARFTNMELAGDLWNATTDLKACCRIDPSVPRRPGPPMDFKNVRGLGEDLQGAKNLSLELENAVLTGRVSSAQGAYREGLTVITQENCEELGEITCTAAPAVNNGVIVTLGGGAVWNVTGECFLTALTVAPGAVLRGANGSTLRMTVDGASVQPDAGVYKGNIHLSAESC